jgi:hypothetical protein
MSRDVLAAAGISSGGTDVARSGNWRPGTARAGGLQHDQQNLNFSVFLRKSFAGHLL